MPVCEDIAALLPGICADYSGGYDEVYVSPRGNIATMALSTASGLENTIGTLTMAAGKSFAFINVVDDTITTEETTTNSELVSIVKFTAKGIPSSTNGHWETITTLIACKCGLAVLFRKKGVKADESDDEWSIATSDVNVSAASIFGTTELIVGEAKALSQAAKSEMRSTEFTLTRKTSLKGFTRALSISTADLRTLNII